MRGTTVITVSLILFFTIGVQSQIHCIVYTIPYEKPELDWVIVTVPQSFPGPNPANPPYGCPNFGLCLPAYLTTSGTPDNYYSCLSTSYCICHDETLLTGCADVPDTCLSNPCSVNGGNWDCQPLINNYQCSCQPGFTGTDCTMIDPSPCSSSPCENGGTCSVKSDTYSCKCPWGKAGDRCQYSDTCALQPGICQNNGVCSMIFHGEHYYCTCKAAWQGRHCDQAVNYPIINDMGCWKYSDSYASSTFLVNLGDKPSPALCKAQLDTKIAAGGNYNTYSIIGTKCYLSLGVPWNQTTTDGCDWKCSQSASGSGSGSYSGANDLCGSSNKKATLVIQYTVWADPEQCLNKTCVDGACVEANQTATCLCPRERTGAGCVTVRLPTAPCNSNLCSNDSECSPNFEDFSYNCTCDVMHTGKYCDQTLYCVTDPCKYGSKCVEKGSDYSCECLTGYTGKNCDVPNFCVSNPCNNGVCEVVPNGLESSYQCNCNPGWTGKYCTTDIDECALNVYPCKYGGLCTQITPPADPFYTCTCVPGTEGKNCETNPDDCIYENINGKKYSTCNKSDSEATCVDGFDAYTCKCGPDYTGQYCDIELMIYDILMKIFGDVNDEMLGMMKELLANPSMIKDLVPFILGLDDEVTRCGMSWDHEDLFDWATYEEQRLDLQRDLVKWNDVTLGNCFTFNHRNSSGSTYLKRMSGQMGGFHALMKINGEEYFPWVDTEAIQVFVHPSEDDIFSESVRYNAQPNGETEIYPYLTEYSRLAGKYGVCVDDPSEVKAYYYTGSYTTDGCLRACYQNAVLEECGCMDPRYPMPSGVTPCNLQKRNCVEDVSVIRGDPSAWKDCVCPLPCRNRQYSVRWSKSVYVAEPPQCQFLPTEDRKNCSLAVQDTVLVRVTLTGLDYSLFEEVPAMDFNRFIGNLGGLLGVLCGISIITFIEIGFLIVRVWIIVASNK